MRFWEPFLGLSALFGFLFSRGTGTLQLRKRFAHPQFLLPGKPCRSLKEVDVKAEERRRRREMHPNPRFDRDFVRFSSRSLAVQGFCRHSFQGFRLFLLGFGV